MNHSQVVKLAAALKVRLPAAGEGGGGAPARAGGGGEGAAAGGGGGGGGGGALQKRAADASLQEGRRAPKAARAATSASPGPQFTCLTSVKVQILTPGELGVLQEQQVR